MSVAGISGRGGAMRTRFSVADHLGTEELAARYRAARDPIERTSFLRDVAVQLEDLLFAFRPDVAAGSPPVNPVTMTNMLFVGTATAWLAVDSLPIDLVHDPDVAADSLQSQDGSARRNADLGDAQIG